MLVDFDGEQRLGQSEKSEGQSISEAAMLGYSEACTVTWTHSPQPCKAHTFSDLPVNQPSFSQKSVKRVLHP